MLANSLHHRKIVKNPVRRRGDDPELRRLETRAEKLSEEIRNLEQFLSKAPEKSMELSLERLERGSTLPPPEEWVEEPVIRPMSRRQLVAAHRQIRRSFFGFIATLLAVASIIWWIYSNTEWMR